MQARRLWENTASEDDAQSRNATIRGPVTFLGQGPSHLI